MKRFIRVRVFVLSALLAVHTLPLWTGLALAQQPSPSNAPARPPAPTVTPSHQVDFSLTDNVMPLKSALTPYHAPGGPEKDGSLWYMLALTNKSVRPVSRVILAGQPPSMTLALLPRSSRPQVMGWPVPIPAWWWKPPPPMATAPGGWCCRR